MTYNELLAEIGYNAEKTSKALRAVVELHRPQKLYGLAPIYSDELFCKQCDVLYPCPTIQAIEKELG
jgi:glutamate dehydrogenase/leucine dehydrogenase